MFRCCLRRKHLGVKTDLSVVTCRHYIDDLHSFGAAVAFMRKFCGDNNWLEPSERAINQTFSHQVNYARRRLKLTGHHQHSYLSPIKPKKLCAGLHQMSPADSVDKDCYKTEPYSQPGLV